VVSLNNLKGKKTPFTVSKAVNGCFLPYGSDWTVKDNQPTLQYDEERTISSLLIIRIGSIWNRSSNWPMRQPI
jgi:hypothetical protein